MKILCILGTSATGKDTTVAEILKTDKRFRKAVSYTTRPKRSSEVDGKDYHFITEDKFLEKLEKNEFLETTSYDVGGKTWRYGYAKDSFNSHFINLVICNPRGLSQFKKTNYKRFIKPILLDCAKKERKRRYFARDKFAKLEEWESRVLEDKKDFKDIFLLCKDFKEFLYLRTDKLDILSVAEEIKGLC